MFSKASHVKPPHKRSFNCIIMLRHRPLGREKLPNPEMCSSTHLRSQTPQRLWDAKSDHVHVYYIKSFFYRSIGCALFTFLYVWHISRMSCCNVRTYLWVAYYCLVYIFWISIAYFMTYFFELPNASWHIFWMPYCVVMTHLWMSIVILYIFLNAYYVH